MIIYFFFIELKVLFFQFISIIVSVFLLFRWTFIDYEKFQKLVKEYEKSGTQFTSMDYIAKTPAWAVYGAKEGGFDPQDSRVMRKKKKDISGC
jgi:hypothetical protein